MPQDNPHLLVITPFYSPNIGGVETHLDDLTAFLQKRGFRQTIITYKPLTTPNTQARFHQKEKNISIFRLPWLGFNLFYRLENKPLFQFPYLFTGIFIFSFFYLLLNFRKISVIHGHGLAAAVATYLLSKAFNKRAVVSLHTIYKFNDRPVLAKIMRKIFLGVDSIIVLAQGVKDDLTPIGIPEGKVSVFTNWLDLKNQFYPQDKIRCREKLGLGKNDFIALFVGRLSPEKGVGLLLKTIPKVSRKITFVIVGGGPMVKEVEEICKKYTNVKFVGPVKSEILPYYNSTADVLLWGSVDQDYFGRVTMGALACGLPVIIPSETEYFGRLRAVTLPFPQGKIGYMLKPDPKIVAQKLEELATSKKLAQMRNACRAYALKHFSEKNAEVFLKAYRS